MSIFMFCVKYLSILTFNSRSLYVSITGGIHRNQQMANDIWSITGSTSTTTQETHSWPTHNNGHISIDSFLITIDRFNSGDYNNSNNKGNNLNAAPPPLYTESEFDQPQKHNK